MMLRKLFGPKRASPRQEVQTGDERPTNVATLLANEFGSDKGDLHHGRHHYTRVYSEYFEPIRYRSLRVLELGLLHISDPGWDDPSRRDQGGTIGRRAPSMEMWARYFPNSEIIGFDINEFQDLKIERCTILRGDMSNRRELGRVLDFGPFDIIIDDASHASHHQQIALGFLFPHLVLGGTYWIEDLNDQPPALEIPGIAKTKALLSQLEITGKFPSDWLLPDEISALESTISTIEFYDSMQSGARHYRDNLAVLTKK